MISDERARRVRPCNRREWPVARRRELASMHPAGATRGVSLAVSRSTTSPRSRSMSASRPTLLARRCRYRSQPTVRWRPYAAAAHTDAASHARTRAPKAPSRSAARVAPERRIPSIVNYGFEAWPSACKPSNLRVYHPVRTTDRLDAEIDVSIASAYIQGESY